MSKQDRMQHIPLIQGPAPYDEEDLKFWKNMNGSWKLQGQPWRWEPEIGGERQKFLAERLSIAPNSKQGIYPFKDIKLSRADIEWLLSTHENRHGTGPTRGPIDWSDESQRGRYGLDVRGADLRNVNFAYLPLACMGRVEGEHEEVFGMMLQNERPDAATIHLEGAILKYSHLQGANFQEAFFDNLTLLNESVLGDTKYGAVALADVRWGDVNVAVVDWSTISVLGDEVEARKSKKDADRDKVK